MANPIVHFEIMAADGQKEALQAFYRDTFDWKITPAGDMQYGIVEKPTNDGGIRGAVDASPEGPSVVIYISSDNIHAAVAKAKANGAEILMDVTTIPGMVTFAQFRDPAGNVMGIVDSTMPGA